MGEGVCLRVALDDRAAVGAARHLKAVAVRRRRVSSSRCRIAPSKPPLRSLRASYDRETPETPIRRAIAFMPCSWPRRFVPCALLIGDGFLARLDRDAALGFVGRRQSAGAGVGAPRGSGAAEPAERGGLALEFAEDGFFVVEQVADEAVGVALVQGEGVFGAGAQDAGGEGLREVGDEGLVRGGQVDQAREVRGDGVEGGDVVEPELAEGGLQDFDAWGGVGGGGGDGVGLGVAGGGVDGLDDFVDLGRDEGVLTVSG